MHLNEPYKPCKKRPSVGGRSNITCRRHVTRWSLGRNPSPYIMQYTRVLTRSRRILSARQYDSRARANIVRSLSWAAGLRTSPFSRISK